MRLKALLVALLPTTAVAGEERALTVVESGGDRASGLDAAIRRGVDFLLDKQNRDGSWGSARRTKGLNIYAPVPGAHQGFRAAVTALCVSALSEIAAEDARATGRVSASLRRGEDWLLKNLPRVRRATPDALYNVWAHGYGIQALVRRARASSADERRSDAFKALIRDQIGWLTRYELVNGGWSYYDFELGSQKPAGSPTCFTTSTMLVALAEAKEIGVDAPPNIVERALASVRRQQKPDFSYAYGEYLRLRPMRPINRPGGSLGRSQVCNLALRLWGDERITDAILKEWLERLFARNPWLGMGRKRPIPHESWFQVAGYFYYYGHYYAACCIELLKPADRLPFQRRMADLLIGQQEKDGSWWDYPFYDYHQPYGTALALMTLGRCRR